MALWTFRDYLDASGQSVIEEWLAGFGPKRIKVEARLDARLEHIQNLEQARWPRETGSLNWIVMRVFLN
jgi:hypothetical protein